MLDLTPPAVMNHSVAGEKGDVFPHLGDSGVADLLVEHVLVVARGMSPTIELLEWSVVVPTHIFHTHPSA